MDVSARGTARDPSYTRERSRSPAQLFCLVVGATLVLVGLLGFLVEAKFDVSTGGECTSC